MQITEMRMVLTDASIEWAMPDDERQDFLDSFETLVEDALKYRKFIGNEQSR